MAQGYLHSEPFDSGFLPVGSIHRLWYQQCGKKDGRPVVFLHGGPGGMTSLASASFFNPAIYRVVLFDQRGAGKSLPVAELRENTSQHLVEDIEQLRKALGIEKWHMVFGGSWGSTLALLYTQTHPEAVGTLVLRGVFTAREVELSYGFTPGKGPTMLFPEEFDRFINYLPAEDRTEPIKGYHKLVTSDDPAIWVPAAKEWNRWETSASKVIVPDEDFEALENQTWSLQHAKMETHYFLNGGFMEEGQLLRQESIDKIRHIPCK